MGLQLGDEKNLQQCGIFFIVPKSRGKSTLPVKLSLKDIFFAFWGFSSFSYKTVNSRIFGKCRLPTKYSFLGNCKLSRTLSKSDKSRLCRESWQINGIFEIIKVGIPVNLSFIGLWLRKY